ncbi:hypothetical protein UPYG_G00242660 [Umbra pygmaea]|uniref:MYND-type domain-containing protein n=1 Tax=Umbra pygmaea TaxID=75934 RepID=A0ABD0X1U1_UMBPY
MVTDASGLPLGFDWLASGWAGLLSGCDVAEGDGNGPLDTTQRIVGLLRHCMEALMCGGLPRRPLTLLVNDRKLTRLLTRLEKAFTVLKVSLWPQALGDWCPEGALQEDRGEAFSMNCPPRHYCHLCKKYSFPSELEPCSGCEAVLYCSDLCSHADHTNSLDDAGHHRWCDQLACYMSRHSQLADMPFSYATGHSETFVPLKEEDNILLCTTAALNPGISPTKPLVPELNILNKRSLKIHIIDSY